MSTSIAVLQGMKIEDYRWVMLVASIMMFELTITGFVGGGGRKKTFSDAFIKEHFEEKHKEAFPDGRPLPKEGYPDTGSGKFSEKLAYKDWYEFNSRQRAHYNFLESATSVVCWLLIAGLLYPWVAVAFGGAYCIGRFFYTYGYVKSGPKGRRYGFLLSLLSATVLFAFSLVSPIQMAVEWTY